MDLEKAREQIDEIDEKIMELFKLRMGVVKEIGTYKREHNIPIQNPAREREIIEKHVKRAPKELEMYVEIILEELMKVSREYQGSQTQL